MLIALLTAASLQATAHKTWGTAPVSREGRSVGEFWLMAYSGRSGCHSCRLRSPRHPPWCTACIAYNGWRWSVANSAHPSLLHVGRNAVCSQTAYRHYSLACSFSLHRIFFFSYTLIVLQLFSDWSLILFHSFFVLPKPFLRSSFHCCPIVVRLLSDCCSINERTTDAHQTHFNRTRVGAEPWVSRR